MSVTFTAYEQTGPASWRFVDEAPEINVSNTNARDLLALLGIEFGDGGGHLAAVDFVNRVLVALAQLEAAPALDSGRAVRVEGILIDCGQRPGYLRERLTQLLAIGRAAVELGAVVGWA